MNRALALSFALSLLAATAASAQQTATDLRGASDPSRFDLAAGYNLINANAPPGECGCFTMNGGFVSGQVNLSPWLGAVGEVSMGHASQISALGQNLTLTTFMAGPRISLPSQRFVPFGEFLVGGARGTGSYFPTSASSTTSASSFAYAAGGGLDVNLSHRFAIRAFDAKFLHTSFPNGVNGTQRQLQIGVGLVARFGGSRSLAPMPAPTQSREPKRFSLNCSTTNQLVAVGQPVHITGETTLDPDLFSIHYSWSSTGGVIRGDGTAITIDTSNLKPGTYEVDGRASLDSNLSKTSSCKVTFQVTRASEAKDQILMTKFSAPPGGVYDDGTREHLKDLFFNYDQSDLRPDAANANVDNAAYLVAHPDIKLTIAGYADERGSAEYNLALGMQRAVAARDALISAGVEASRLKVISYGKERAFCADDDESCFQQNRRAQMVLDSQ
jgi:peptidoglycan-associated lipoprotein